MSNTGYSAEESGYLLSSVLNSLGRCLIIADGVIIRSSESASTLLGFNAQQLVGKNIWDILPFGVKEGESVIKTADGKLKTFNCETKSLGGNSKNEFILIFNEYSDSLFRILTENSFVGIYIYKDRFIYANPEYQEKTGYTLNELKTMSPYDLVCEDEKQSVRDSMNRRLAGEIFYSRYQERRIVSKSGVIKTFRVASSTITIDGGFAGIGSSIDITDLKEFQTGLEEKVLHETRKRHEQEQLLIQQSKLAEMGAMIGSIAHQWKQPLSAVSMLIQDLMRTHDEKGLDRDYLTWVHNTATEQISYMSDTVNDFMSFLRPSKERSLFSIEDSIRPTIQIFSHQAAANNIFIEMTCDSMTETPNCGKGSISGTSNVSMACDNCVCEKILVEGYRNEFMQVLLNILNNAKDAIISAHKKGILATGGRIYIRIRNSEGKVSIEIEDNGGGIPDHIKERIFEPYFTTKGAENGTGIGLYMVRSIVENSMNGHVSVKNGEKGAVFSLTFERH